MAAHTQSSTSPSPGPPFAECGGWPEFSVVSEEIRSLPCGPCGFDFDAARSQQHRAQRPDACCYATKSPPLGRPLMVAMAPRVAPLRQASGWAS